MSNRSWQPHRTVHDSKVVFGWIAFTVRSHVLSLHKLSGTGRPAVLAAVVMLVVGFFFAAVSGNLVGLIGSSNNPVSGLTLSTLLIAALLMVATGVSGQCGVAAVLGVAAVVCVSSAVAGEMLQDFKVGYILGGTPRTIQIGELIAVVVASLVMYFPLMLLYEGNITSRGHRFGDRQLPGAASRIDGSPGHGHRRRQHGRGRWSWWEFSLASRSS